VVESGNGGTDGAVSGTTATVAGKLGCKTAPDLIVAAAAHLTFVAKKAEFSRKEQSVRPPELAEDRRARGCVTHRVAHSQRVCQILKLLVSSTIIDPTS
jgi:hypothetical protein